MRLTLSLVAIALSLLTALSLYTSQSEPPPPARVGDAPPPNPRAPRPESRNTRAEAAPQPRAASAPAPSARRRASGALPPLQESVPAPREPAPQAPPLPPLSAINLERDGPLGGTRAAALARTQMGPFWRLIDEAELRFEQQDQLATLQWEEVDGRVIGLRAELGEQAQALPMALLGLVAGTELDFERFGPWERERPPLRPLEGTLQRADGRQIYYWARFHERCAPTCGLAELRFRLGAPAAP